MQRAVVVLAFLSALFVVPFWAYAMPTIDNVIPHILMDTKKSWIPMPKKMQQKMRAEKRKKAEKQRKAEEKRFKGGINNTVSTPQKVPVSQPQTNTAAVPSSTSLPPKQEVAPPAIQESTAAPAANVPIAPTPPVQATPPRLLPAVPKPLSATPRMPIGASTTVTANPTLTKPLGKPDSVTATTPDAPNSPSIDTNTPQLPVDNQTVPADAAEMPNKINKGGIGAVGGIGKIGNPHAK